MKPTATPVLRCLAMTKTVLARLLVVVGGFAVSCAVALAQPGVAGNWTLDVDSPQGIMKVDLVLALQGEAVTGSIASEMGESKFTGSAKEGTVTFTFDMTGPQGPMTIITKATVSGDEIKGEMDYGQGVAPFTGKRAER